jgi:AcrR family transcriptional regulator
VARTSQRTDTTERILTAAADLFATHGYAATTTRAIASAAEVNEATLFRRFGSKSGVLRALGEQIAADSAGGAIDVLDARADLRTTLRSLARAEIDSAQRHGGLALRLAFDARSVPEVAELIGSGTDRNLAALTAYLASYQQSGQKQSGQLRADVDAQLLAEAFFALTSSFVLGRQLLGSADVVGDEQAWPDLSDRLVELFLDGAAVPD